jgi:hypothetical protein
LTASISFFVFVDKSDPLLYVREQIVSPETIGLAKHTFLYSMVRMSYRSTKRKIPQGKRKKVLKRGRDGKFISSLDPEGSGTSASDAASSA